MGFDPADNAQYAAEAAPILGGPPIGEDGDALVVSCACSVAFLSCPPSVHSSTIFTNMTITVAEGFKPKGTSLGSSSKLELALATVSSYYYLTISRSRR